MGQAEDTAQRLIEAERVSVRVVVVADGEDPTPHLLKAGIVDPVIVPFAWADDERSAGMMGDGRTSGVTATLEFDDEAGESFAQHADPADRPAVNPPSGSNLVSGSDPVSETRTVQLPEAFGLKPMAPVRRRL